MWRSGLNSIEAYRLEISGQPESVSDMMRDAGVRSDGGDDCSGRARDGRPAPPRPLSESEQRQSIFAGSGDSLAASMLAEYFSEGRARAMDPSDILRNPRLAYGMRRLYLISVSGNTAANIRVARRFADASVAVTASPHSRLAKAAGAGIIPIRFCRAGDTPTAGSASFVSSAIASVSLVRDMRGMNPDAQGLLRRARLDASAIDVGGSLYLLGDLLTYPLAMYGAAKFYEVLGYDARYARTEQFSHMELFSASRGDTVVLLEEPGPRTHGLADTLRDAGINAIIPDSMASVQRPRGGGKDGRGRREFAHVLYCSFLVQAMALDMAERRGLKECHFVDAREMRRASNESIY